ncbi:MAG: hypothetical protein QXV69_05735 [Sulfolobaceae archaeon]
MQGNLSTKFITINKVYEIKKELSRNKDIVDYNPISSSLYIGVIAISLEKL